MAGHGGVPEPSGVFWRSDGLMDFPKFAPVFFRIILGREDFPNTSWDPTPRSTKIDPVGEIRSVEFGSA